MNAAKEKATAGKFKKITADELRKVRANNREIRRRSLNVAIMTSNSLIDQLRWCHSSACKDDALLAMVLLARLESAVKIKERLREIVACLEVVK